MFSYFLCLIYLWYCYSIFFTKTYGSFIYMGLILITCLSLCLSIILFLIKLNNIYLLIPILPHCLCIYWDKKIRKKINI